jgi:hypothetical protein
MDKEGVAVPDLQTAMDNEAALYETLGLGPDKSAIQSQMLFDIGSGFLQYGSNVGPDGRPMQGSGAARFNQALAPIAGKIGARAGQMSKEEQALKLMRLKGSQDKIAAAQASNAALGKNQTEAAIKLAQQPKLSVFGEQFSALTKGGLTPEQAINRLMPEASSEALSTLEREYNLLIDPTRGGLTPEQAINRLMPADKGSISAMESQYNFLIGPGGLTPEQAIATVVPSKTTSAMREKIEILRELNPEITNDQIIAAIGLNPSLDSVSAAEEEIARLMEATKMTRNEVIISLQNRVSVDPESGAMSITNAVTKSAEPLSLEWGDVLGIRGPNEIPVALKRVTSEMINEQIRGGKGTGLWVTLKDKYNSYAGQLPLFKEIKFDSQVEAANQLDTLEALLLDAYRSGRTPVVQLNTLLALLPGSYRAGLRPEDAELNLRNVADLAGTQYVEDIRNSNDPSLSNTMQRESVERANGLKTFLNQILTPAAAQSIFSAADSTLASVADFQTMGLADLMAMQSDVSSMDTETYNAFSAIAKQRIAENEGTP